MDRVKQQIESVRKCIQALYIIALGSKTEGEFLASDKAKMLFIELVSLDVADLYYIVLNYSNYPTYKKICLREDLQTPRVERGLFNHIVINGLRIHTVNAEHDWKTFLLHIPGARDLKWNYRY